MHEGSRDSPDEYLIRLPARDSNREFDRLSDFRILE